LREGLLGGGKKPEVMPDVVLKTRSITIQKTYERSLEPTHRRCNDGPTIRHILALDRHSSYTLLGSKGDVGKKGPWPEEELTRHYFGYCDLIRGRSLDESDRGGGKKKGHEQGVLSSHYEASRGVIRGRRYKVGWASCAHFRKVPIESTKEKRSRIRWGRYLQGKGGGFSRVVPEKKKIPESDIVTFSVFLNLQRRREKNCRHLGAVSAF